MAARPNFLTAFFNGDGNDGVACYVPYAWRNLRRLITNLPPRTTLARLMNDAPSPPPANLESKSFWRTEDAWAVILGGLLLALSTLFGYAGLKVAEQGEATEVSGGNALASSVAKIGGWTNNPLHGIDAGLADDWSFQAAEAGGEAQWGRLLFVLCFTLVLFGVGAAVMGDGPSRFTPGFLLVFVVATLSYLLAEQTTMDNFSLSYALWAIVLGMLVSNTLGTPEWAKPALKAEFYIKTGLVLLGGEVLLGRLGELAAAGVVVSWVVTPIVLVGTYLFGQHVLKIASKTLNITLSADMSVCGVSAAIATAAACKAKREELSLAVGISMLFTAVMMVVLPFAAAALDLPPRVAGAWIGGTVDATGAVAAAGESLRPLYERTYGEEGAAMAEAARDTAVTIKMIQNILIGVIAFAVAVYWTTYVDRAAGERPRPIEIWRRFPKFVLGFVAASAVFSLIYQYCVGAYDAAAAQAIVDKLTAGSKALRGWTWAIGFSAIGLATDFRTLGAHLKGGKPVLLYLCGQSFNLVLTLAAAWLMFGVVLGGE